MGAKTVNLGRIGFVVKGEYSATTSYNNLDVVTYNGNLYAAIDDVPAGTPVTDNTKFQILIDNGSKVNMNQGLNNTGKVLIVGQDGNVTTGDPAPKYGIFA